MSRHAALSDQGGFLLAAFATPYRTRNAQCLEFHRVHAIQQLF